MDPKARGDLQVVRLLTLRPSRDLGRLASDFEVRLPPTFRFLVRGLGTRQTKSPDVLSFLLFEPGYIRVLLEIGERDGEARMGEIEELVRGKSPAAEGSGSGGALTSAPSPSGAGSPPPRLPPHDS
jgi:NTE family protein